MSWYDSYLTSQHWADLRHRKMEQEGHQCERCGHFGRRVRGVWYGLHVHHKTYERVGAEPLDDLEVLCVYCHQVEHGKPGGSREQIRGTMVAKVVEHAGEDIDLEVQQWDELADEAGC